MNKQGSLSFQQARLWFLENLIPDASHYNSPKAFRLQGRLNLAALEYAVNRVIDRHEVLRTAISSDAGIPVTTVLSDRKLSIRVTDMSHVDKEQRMSQVREFLVRAARESFDLERDLMIRVDVVRLAPEDHALLLTLHHIASDGSSTTILAKELSELYDAFVAERLPVLPELGAQYADYVAWQHERMSGERLQSDLEYWLEQLKGLPPLLDLPTDRPRRRQQHHAGGLISNTHPALLDRIRELAVSARCSSFAVLLSAFYVMLGRYTNRTDLVVGTAISGRLESKFEDLIGFFVNTLPLRIDLAEDLRVGEFVQRVRDQIWGALSHQELPFEKLVDAVQSERTLSHAPVVQIMFVQAPKMTASWSFGGLEVASIPMHTETAKFDLTVSVREGGGQLGVDFEYDAYLFDQRTIERMAEHYGMLLTEMVADPERRIGDIPMLSDRERRQLLKEWNGPRVELDTTKCVHELFEAQVQRSPEALAVVCADQELSYRELNARANQLAEQLCGLGVGPETIVAICAERSVGLVVGLLGIWKAGGAYLPLDSSYPGERLAHMLRDSNAALVLTQHGLLDGDITHELPVVNLDNIAWRDGDGLGNPESRIGAEHLAYVIYTSGSTGQPKGVEICHRSLLNLNACHHRMSRLSGADRIAQLANPGFDVSVWEIWPALTAGSAVYIAPDDLRVSASAVAEWFVEHDITVAWIPTALADAMIQVRWPANVRLRLLHTGGDRLTCRPEEPLPFTFMNLYGPTEATVFATSSVVAPHQSSDRPPPIGRPLDNVKTYILDSHLRPVPVGVAGELHIGGACLARGYLKRPELTSEKFILDPFGDEAGARLYKSGDLARYLPDGDIEFLGRIDHQVKIRGFRVELGEIEAVLAQCPGVGEAAVDVHEYAPDDKRLVAYIVARGASPPRQSELREFLSRKLPEYMLPAAYVMLERMPLSDNGKVDRTKLPAPGAGRPDLATEFVPPRSPSEQTLAAMWSRVLGISRVGKHDNFFELGGSSLTAMRVIAGIRSELNVQMPLTSIFNVPTLSGLASEIERSRAARPGVVDEIKALKRRQP